MNEPGQGDNSTPRVEPEIPQQRPWRRRWQEYAAVGWISFLVGGFATMLFFAFVDPAEFDLLEGESLESVRMTGYALGFFFFWLIAGLAGFSVAYLIRAMRRDARRRREQDRTSADE